MSPDDLADRPAWVARVPEEMWSELRALRERRQGELRQAIDNALEHVPRLLRGALRRVLFP